MKFKKTIALLLVCIASISLFTGCNDKQSDSEEIVMATNAQFAPFEYKRDKGLLGNFDGIDVNIALEVANRLGKQLRIDDMEFSSVLMAIPTGNADFAAAGMSITEERLESMDFSIPYFTAIQCIIVQTDNDTIKSADDILEKNVGVVQGYTGQWVCEDDLGIVEPDLKLYKSGAEAALDLKQNSLDAIVIDLYTAEAIVSINEDLKIVYDPETFENEEYAIAVKKGNTELLDTINEVLEEYMSTGKLEELLQYHIAIILEQ